MKLIEHHNQKTEIMIYSFFVMHKAQQIEASSDHPRERVVARCTIRVLWGSSGTPLTLIGERKMLQVTSREHSSI